MAKRAGFLVFYVMAFGAIRHTRKGCVNPGVSRHLAVAIGTFSIGFGVGFVGKLYFIARPALNHCGLKSHGGGNQRDDNQNLYV